MKRFIVTIDGLSASGKSSLGKALATKLGARLFSTGLIYRALGLLLVRNSVSPDDTQLVMKALQSHKISLAAVGSETKVLLDGSELGAEVFTPQVSDAASRASARPEVREKLLELQRSAFPGENLVVEGRDIGTVVFPEAPVKFFISASAEVRSQRRLAQMQVPQAVAAAADLKKTLETEVLARDTRDQNRAVAPTVAAPDAILIDNSVQTLTNVIEQMYAHCLKTLGRLPG